MYKDFYKTHKTKQQTQKNPERTTRIQNQLLEVLWVSYLEISFEKKKRLVKMEECQRFFVLRGHCC